MVFPILSLLLLVSLLAAPALAATATCPSGCSCLLPADAKKLGYSGYCSGTQSVCGYDALKNAMYCYSKAAATITKTTVATTTVTKTTTTQSFSSCPSGCTCLSAETGKGKGLPYCNGKQAVCGYDNAKNPLYCFSTAVTTTTATTTATPFVTCPSGCACLSIETGKLKGLSYCNGKQALCGYDVTQAPLYCFAASIVTTTTETTVPSSCGSGCSCLLHDEAKAKGMSYCNGKQVTCAVPSVNPATGAASASGNKYCYSLPETACPSGCSCLAQDKAEAMGLSRCSGSSSACSSDPLGRPMYCYVYSGTGATGAAAAGTTETTTTGTGIPVMRPLTTTPAAQAADGGAFAQLGIFFAQLFGGKPAATGYRIIECPAGQTDCDGSCVNISSDRRNCGRCRGICYGDGSICCNGVCSNERSADNCGSCGNACSASEPCFHLSGGEWFCSPAGCWNTNESTDCGTGVCVNLLWNRENCGSCGNACPAGLACEDGACISCPEGETVCGLVSACQDILSDPYKCGGCNIVCNPDQICENGRCVACPAGQTRCSRECRDLQTDWSYCGACGRQCVWGETCCSGQCANLQSNATNCGSCGHACGAGSTCIRGTCIYGYGTGDCVGDPCHGECVDYSSDRNNCGTCGHACPDRYYCRESTCTPYYAGENTVCDTPGLDYCSGDCANLQTDESHCGRCGNACLPGDICCNGVCKDLENDANNCGDCGRRCASGQVCCGGVCRADTTGEPGTCGACGHRCVGSGISCCDGTCRDLQHDRTNCGTCGHECGGGQACCNGDCVTLSQNGHNCGTCGHDCAWYEPYCVGGGCTWWPWAGSVNS